MEDYRNLSSDVEDESLKKCNGNKTGTGSLKEKPLGMYFWRKKNCFSSFLVLA
jgi:hypothetical protein